MKRRLLILMMMVLWLPFTALLIGDSLSYVQVRAEKAEPPIPVVRIYNTQVKGGEEVGQAAVDKMNASEDHSVKCTATMDIEVPEGFHYVDSDKELISQKDIAIDELRGRGNTTWLYEGKKKPYKIELDKKKDLLGMGKSKHWALVANVYDPSMMRNRITYWLGHQLNMAFTPDGYPVDVYLEDVYLGSYMLCETIRIEETRVDIDELTETDIDKDVITGGYLMSTLQDDGSISTFTTAKDENLQNIKPSFDPEGGGKADYTNDIQKNYIRDYVQEAEYAIFEGYIKDEDDPSGYRNLDYRDYIDVKSTSLYWLMQEFSRNADAYTTGSSYFYKTRDIDGQKGKIFWGPLWDFDFAWNCNKFEDDEPFYTTMGWMTAMMTDKGEGGLPDQIRKDWPVLKEKLIYITQDDGLIDQYVKELDASQKADFASNQSEYDKCEYRDGQTFEQGVESLREWINRRIDWMDRMIVTDNKLDDYACKVYLKIDPDDEHPQVFCLPKDNFFSDKTIAPEKEGKVFLGWYTEKGENLDELAITEDTVATARFMDYEEAIKPERIYLGSYDKWVLLSSGVCMIDYTLIPRNAQDKQITWTSSDETIAKVNKDDTVQLLDKGVVTITGSFRNGVSTSFTLHVCDIEELAAPSSVKPGQDVIRMQPGEYTQLQLNISPQNAKYSTFYLSDNDDVAQINENGVIYAAGNGKVTVHAYVMNDFGDEMFELEATCQVIVGDEADTTPVELGTPKLKANVHSNKTARLSWKKITGATGYKVAYRKAGAKKWTYRNVTGTKTTIKGLKADKRYQFKVAAVKKNGKSVQTGQYSKVLCRICKVVKGIKCKGKKKSIQISWKKLKGVTGYRILISRNKDLSKAKVIRVKAGRKKYTVKKLKAKKKYYVGIQPYKKSGGKTYLGVLKKKTVKTR